jgi:hypothetical protein
MLPSGVLIENYCSDQITVTGRLLSKIDHLTRPFSLSLINSLDQIAPTPTTPACHMFFNGFARG